METAERPLRVRQGRGWCSPKMGLWWVAAATTLVFGLSLAGEPRATVTTATFIAILVTLTGGLAWIWPNVVAGGPQDTLKKKRLFVVASLCTLASVPLTQWPLRMGLHASQPQLTSCAERIYRNAQISQPLQDALDQSPTGLLYLPMERPQRAGFVRVTAAALNENGTITLLLDHPSRTFTHDFILD